MKRVININFQGRVIPIEETAYDILKQYVESLRRHFANEEGRDEIINDIEGRIAELFSENLKKGATCITDNDINVIIESIGRPEDFEDDEAKVKSQLGAESTQQNATADQGFTQAQQEEPQPRQRLYRDENDKILGGVCSGIANYIRLDPAIVRILFAIITLGGFGSGVLIYILLWAILPSSGLTKSAIRKRLFRNPEDKVIAGVASGIAAYFDIAVWIPRLIFAFPLVASIFVSIFRNVFWDFHMGPTFLFGSFSSSFFVIYVILWVVIPEANSASEKLEMRGEKVDLNSIKNTIQEDLGHFKSKAEKWGTEVKDKAAEWGSEFGKTMGAKGQAFGNEVGGAARRGGSRVFHAIGVIFKAFFLFVAGMLAFALLIGLLTLMMGRINYFPMKEFILSGFWQNALAWATLVLFLGIPVIALITWIIRRLMKVKSKNPYLGYTFSGLWTIGLICVIALAISVARDYRTKGAVEDSVTLAKPSKDKLLLKLSNESTTDYGSDWFGINWDEEDVPFYVVSEDSLLMTTVRVNVVKSADSSYHIRVVKFSRGSSPALARSIATNVVFNVKQADTLITLPRGFAVTQKNKFRNQQVLVIVEVPIGKRIQIDRSVNDYRWFNIDFNNRRRRNWSADWDDNWDNSYSWRENVEYRMFETGLKATQKSRDDQHNEDETRQQLKDLEEQKKDLEDKQKELQKNLPVDTTHYQYKPEGPKTPKEPKAPKAPGGDNKVTASTSVKEGLSEMLPGPSGLLAMKVFR
ncbi:MAG: PspC domain-containing protein [Filimonas sp.]|nr:PspC domain-containing protein [Filimonas sp.]